MALYHKHSWLSSDTRTLSVYKSFGAACFRYALSCRIRLEKEVSQVVYKISILLMICLVLSGCGDSEPKQISHEDWKQVSCLPKKPGEYCLLEGHASEVKAIAFSPDAKLLAAASVRGIVRVWDLSTMQQLAPFTVYENAVCGVDDCTPLFFTSDGKLVYSAMSDFTLDYEAKFRNQSVTLRETFRYPLFFWDVKQHKLDSMLKDCRSRGAWSSYPFVVSPNGQYLASECSNRELGKPEEYFDEQGERIINVCYMPNGESRSPESDNFVVVWDTATKKPIKQLKAGLCGHDASNILALAFRGTELLAGTAGGEVWVWDLLTQKDKEPPMKEIKALGDGVETVTDKVVFSSNGKRVAMIYKDTTVRVYETDSGKELFRITISSKFKNIAFSPDGTYMAGIDSGNYDFKVWDLRNGKPLIEIISRLYNIFQVMLFPLVQTEGLSL